MTRIVRVFFWLEVLGGARSIPGRLGNTRLWWFILPLWWMILLIATVAFVGRSTKFIYVDF